MNLKGKHEFRAFAKLLFYLIPYHTRVLLANLITTFLTFHGNGTVTDVLSIRPYVTVRHPQLIETDPQIHTLLPYIYLPIHTYSSKTVHFHSEFRTRIL
jgi:hypothetical protein